MQAMALLPIKPLDGAAGFRCWKESVLLHLRTLSLAYVLSHGCPASADSASPTAKKWRDDDALCRGYILDTLSDRAFDVHCRRTTVVNLWDALAKTYDLETPHDLQAQYASFQFVTGGGGESVLEQLSRFESLAEVTGKACMTGESADDAVMCRLVLERLPLWYGMSVVRCSKRKTMDELFGIVRDIESQRLKQHQGGDNGDADVEPKARPRRKGTCYRCGALGHIAKNCNTVV